MAHVQVICPSCGRKGTITVADDLLTKTGRGLLAVNIAQKTICKHSFTIYLDTHGEVRDYFTIDFEISLPDLETPQKSETKELPSNKIVDIDLIRLNLPADLLTFILKCIFHHKDIVLLLEQAFLKEHLLNFFHFITKNTFDITISILAKQEYEQTKKEHKQSMVFEGFKIVNNPQSFINPKKLHIEKMIVNKFLSKTDLGYGYIILKNEIEKVYTLSSRFLTVMNDRECCGEPINSLQIANQIEKELDVSINNEYLQFLLDVLEHYFGKKAPPITDSFLGLI
ncbi:MAG: hypothetical protein BAJALOKI1v1_70034 [Promethearchaeota archaeon]|nr:MAG: hypothetical protein BAJALOKI1v1_70034 [Candidatus Lokiarchaeota archaeon]